MTTYRLAHMYSLWRDDSEVLAGVAVKLPNKLQVHFQHGRTAVLTPRDWMQPCKWCESMRVIMLVVIVPICNVCPSLILVSRGVILLCIVHGTIGHTTDDQALRKPTVYHTMV